MSSSPSSPRRWWSLGRPGEAAAGVSINILTPRREGEAKTTVTTDLAGHAKYVYRHRETAIQIDYPGYVTTSLPAETPATQVQLRRGVPVQGRVSDESGAPVTGCIVSVVRPTSPHPYRSESDGAGFFSMGWLDPTEEVTLTFRHPEHPHWRHRGKPPENGAWRLTLPRGRFVSGRVKFPPDATEPETAYAFIMKPEASSPSPPAGVVLGVEDGATADPETRQRTTETAPSCRGGPRRVLSTRTAGGKRRRSLPLDLSFRATSIACAR